MSVERVQLPHGRLFEYSAAGDPDGERLVFCVGKPSAVLECPSAVSCRIWGWLDDELACASPWGFDVADIRVPHDRGCPQSPLITDLLDAAAPR